MLLRATAVLFAPLAVAAVSCGQDSVAIPAAFAEAQTARAERLLDAGLGEGRAFSMLSALCAVAPNRLSGSAGYAAAVDWAESTMLDLGFENVRREAVLVPHWVRGPVESCTLHLAEGETVELAACALGGSVGTHDGPVRAEVIEVDGLEALESVADQVAGKIVFFSRRLDPLERATFRAYGGAVGQRTRGPVAAAKLGAVGVLVRSMSTADDDVPHTGATRYEVGVPRIPALALGVRSAERLAALLRSGQRVEAAMALSCESYPDVEQWNVLGELRGASKPEEIVVVSGHLDAWDKGVGAHDDGGGCVQAIEAVRLLMETGIRPARTIRVVLFANEENGLRGGRAYAAQHGPAGDHFLALESDSGVFAPRGIALSLPDPALELLRPLGAPLAAVGAERVLPNGGGADIGPLREHGVRLGSLRVEDAAYFDLHHSDNDVLAAVHPRELELGAIVFAYWLAVLGDAEAAWLDG